MISRPIRARTIALLLSLVFLPVAGALARDDDREHDEFANPHLLLTTTWLAEHGHDDGVVVVDVRSNKDFASGHVPGAVSIPTPATYDPKVRGNIGTPEQIADLLGAKGITSSTHVVIYDGGKSTKAARVFWTLEVYGHAQVSVIDGGFAKWRAEEQETTGEPSEFTAVEYEIGTQPERLSTLEQILEDIDNPEVVMLDVRSTREFNAGRIPAAVRIDWLLNYTSDDVPVFKSPTELRKIYVDQGVTPDKRVHAY